VKNKRTPAYSIVAINVGKQKEAEICWGRARMKTETKMHVKSNGLGNISATKEKTISSRDRKKNLERCKILKKRAAGLTSTNESSTHTGTTAKDLWQKNPKTMRKGGCGSERRRGIGAQGRSRFGGREKRYAVWSKRQFPGEWEAQTEDRLRSKTGKSTQEEKTN